MTDRKLHALMASILAIYGPEPVLAALGVAMGEAGLLVTGGQLINLADRLAIQRWIAALEGVQQTVAA